MGSDFDLQQAKEAAREAGKVGALLESIASQVAVLTQSHRQSSGEFSHRIAAVENLKERYEESRIELRELGKQLDAYRIASEKVATQVKIYAGIAGGLGMLAGGILVNYLAAHLK